MRIDMEAFATALLPPLVSPFDVHCALRVMRTWAHGCVERGDSVTMFRADGWMVTYSTDYSHGPDRWSCLSNNYESYRDDLASVHEAIDKARGFLLPG
jgi:hypothetical protein